MDAIKRLVADAASSLTALRRDLHRHPELGRQERRTSALIEEVLKNLGLDVKRVTGTGLSAVLKGGRPGPTLLLRADLDALPVQEATGLPYASETPGVMHACGHDGHAAILTTAARLLTGCADRLGGSIKFVFEPNEEEVGALAMIEEGVLSDPDVTAAAGLHLWAPLEFGKIAVDDGATWAGMDHFLIKVRGRGGHTASPHLAVDPILAAAQIVNGVQALSSRELDPFLPFSLVFGRIQGGSAANVIPAEVELEGTIRYLFDGADDGPHRPRARFKELAERLAAAFRAEAEVVFYCSQPPLINDPAMAALGRAAAVRTLGSAEGLAQCRNLGGEDFSEFSRRVPSVFAVIGAGSVESGAVHPHHNEKFRLDERALAVGLEWLLRTSLAYLETTL
ncbi:MAG: amidohydrolase [Deltaproteobacteria bacterium]|jgi:amidohydrolase|nr:amidohydrolase [Deltaproteobacteria bacterium]